MKMKVMKLIVMVTMMMAFLVVVVFLEPCASGQMQAGYINLPPGLEFFSEYLLGAASDGLVNPEMYYMRYRLDEYDPSDPFFQWWYYTIKDLGDDVYFAFDLSQSICLNPAGNKTDNTGTYIMFSMIDRAKGTQFHQYDRYSLDDMEVDNVTEPGRDGLKIRAPREEVKYSIDFIDHDTYRVVGEMAATEKWCALGTLDNVPIDPNRGVMVRWDLTIHRLYGWYGQHDIEEVAKQLKVISWNTYAHTCEVGGWIEVNGERYDFDPEATYYDELTGAERPKYRAYCDMNWGANPPRGEPAIKYPWGWYYVGLPGIDSNQEIGIIAGIGRADTNSPAGISEGQFADICLPHGERLGVRRFIALKLGPEGTGTVMADTASDSDGSRRDVLAFEVEHLEWGAYTDALGTAQIPYRQIVRIETKYKRVTLDFHSRPENYNRLLFPHQDYIFSDFEGLGATCQVRIEEKHYPLRRSSGIFPRYSIQYEFTSNDAGIQYGYLAPLSPGRNLKQTVMYEQVNPGPLFRGANPITSRD
jgi:hypothetical protein